MASRAERQRRRRRDEEEGAERRHHYDNEALESDELYGRRHGDRDLHSRLRDEPEPSRAQVHRPRHRDDYRDDDRHLRSDHRSEHRRGYDDDGYDRHRRKHHDRDDHTSRETDGHRRNDDRSAQPRRYDDDSRRQRYRDDPSSHSRRHEGGTSRRPKHPDRDEQPSEEDDAYVRVHENAEQPRQDRRQRSRRRQPESEAPGFKEDGSHGDPSRTNLNRSQPRQPYDSGRVETTFELDDPYAESRARVHKSRPKKPDSQTRRGPQDETSPYTFKPDSDRTAEEEPLPPYFPSKGNHQEQPTPLSHKNGEGDADDDEPSSSTVTVDLEMVEMRHPERLYRAQQQQKARRKYQKYQKSPSSDSAVRVTGVQRAVRASAYSTLSVKSWSELDTELSDIKRDLNKHFKPIFDKHGKEGVLVKKLKEELNSRSSQHLLGRESIAQRLRDADRDGDEYLSYADFVSMITKDLQEEKKLAFRGMLLSAIGSIGILPKEKRDNFLASHKLCPPPLFIPIITLIQVIIFAVYVADMEKRGLEVTASSGYPFYSPLPYMPKRRWQAWRFLTYMFIHDGYLHILYNVISQLLFGLPLEMVHGWWRTAIIYLTGVAAGSLAHSVVDPAVGLVGASGGVYAIMGAHLAAVVTNWKEMNYKLCDQEEFDSRPCCAVSRLFVSAPFRLALVVLIVLPDTALAIFRRVALEEDLRVGISAHVGGFLTGLFLGIPVLKNVNKHAWETNLGWVTLVVFLLVSAFAIFFNSFFDDRYPPTDWS